MCRIEYWCQETIESGKWCLTDIMPLHIAKKIINSEIYESASINLEYSFNKPKLVN